MSPYRVKNEEAIRHLPPKPMPHAAQGCTFFCSKDLLPGLFAFACPVSGFQPYGNDFRIAQPHLANPSIGDTVQIEFPQRVLYLTSYIYLIRHPSGRNYSIIRYNILVTVLNASYSGNCKFGFDE
jgi:hypothetical protein